MDNSLIRTKVAVKLEERMSVLNCSEVTMIEPQWKSINEVLTHTQKTDIGQSVSIKKQPWMTHKILELMAERNTSNDQYMALDREVRLECRRTKQLWLAERCEEIEVLQVKHDIFNLYKKSKDFPNRQSKKIQKGLKNTNNGLLVGIEEKLNR